MKYTIQNPMNFNEFKWEQVLVDCKSQILLCQERISKIKEMDASFENTILGLEHCDSELNHTVSIFSALVGVNKDITKTDEIDEIDSEINSLTTQLENDIIFDLDLFKKVEEVYLNRSNLFGEDLKLIEETYKGFIENGINLKKEIQNRLGYIDTRLGELSIEIQSNLLKEPLNWFINIKEDEIDGIPADLLSSAKKLAEERSETGFTFQVTESNFYTIVENSNHQSIRIKFTDLFRSTGNNNDEFDTKNLITELISLRQEKAKILGFAGYSDYVLRDRMVKNEQTVVKFLNELDSAIRPEAEKECVALMKLAKIDGIEMTMADDWYYESKLKSKLCNVNLAELRNYFEYSHVWAGLQSLIYNLYSVSFEKVDFPVYHNAVDCYIAKEGDNILGVIYLDSFSRNGKNEGAWMLPIIHGCENQIPFILVANNFTPKNQDGISLLSLTDTKTLFHEMGHALHELFSKAKYASFAGSNVAWDFVELPSQIMENFVYNPDVLSLIAKHYQTGELLSKETGNNLREMDKLFNATGILSHIGLGRLDLKLHRNNDGLIDFESVNDEYNNCRLYKTVSNKANRVTNFDHILCGGYAVGYYSYQYAKVLDSNCYLKLKEGNFSPDLVKDFRSKILAVGSTIDPMDAFCNFCGEMPNVSVFLKLMGY
jgi:Zn-dependent oligopeptidase